MLFFKRVIGILAFDSFQYNLSLLATLPSSEHDEAEMYWELAGTGRVDGIILAAIQPQDMRIPLQQKIGIPFRRLLDENDLSCPFVNIDGKTGVWKLVEHVYAMEHLGAFQAQ
ncbi:hypothetical protein [Ktedonospora formicarum]|uniref:Uncharacterized protein n=1 Tax=Ktedonospora formicarum TaxID=2778364 RepID=A0A8J3I1P3_9CHLR|nr:hypothetical protein [Ktedonospora formicarum]GHO47699.1 hypothetical protein KSX_58620 [Ktedonospora formicarum]